MNRTIPALCAVLALVAPCAKALAAPPEFYAPVNPYGLRDVESQAEPEAVDLDGDGDLDALLGNGDGDFWYFENVGTPTSPVFAAPLVNPFGLSGIGTLVAPAVGDLDGDGDFDLLAGDRTSGDCHYFENLGTPGGPSFGAPVLNPFGLTPSFTTAQPEIADLDADGDLDVLVGRSTGNTHYYENVGTTVAPSFAAPLLNGLGLPDLGSGGGASISPALVDADADGDLDAFLTQGLATHWVENVGTAVAPSFAAPVAEPFGLSVSPMVARPLFADFDGDGDVDALVGLADGNTIFHQNVGSAATPEFVDAVGLYGLPNLGSPVFADIDADGDLDAFGGWFTGSMAFSENVGTPTEPAFAPRVLDPFGFVDVTPVGSDVDPAFGDLDGDGDLDCLVAAVYGEASYFENIGTAAAPAFAPPVTDPFGLPIDIGSTASPAIADLDGDGLLDLLVGKADGDIDFYPNKGTAAVPVFASFATNFFGLTNVGSSAAPDLVDFDGDGDFDAFVGNGDGDTLLFENVGSPVAPSFAAPLTNAFGLSDAGEQAQVAFVDLDGDGNVEGIVDTNRLYVYENLASACPTFAPLSCTMGFGKAQVLVNEKKPGKEKLLVKLLKGPALLQSSFGDPTVADGTSQAVCLYDDAGLLAFAADVDRAGEMCGTKPCWKSLGGAPPAGKGFGYKDKAGTSFGVSSITFKGGDAGKSKILIKAGNNEAKGILGMPTGVVGALGATTEVIVHVRTSDGGCFGASLTDVATAGDFFLRAK